LRKPDSKKFAAISKNNRREAYKGTKELRELNLIKIIHSENMIR